MATKLAEQEKLISKVRAYVEEYMNNFDGSHDFNHIKRVVGLAHRISSSIAASSTTDSSTTSKPLDLTVVTLAAMLHDVGDRKYLKEGQDPKTQVRDLLLGFGADAELARKIQTICLGVSFNSEMKDLEYVRNLIVQYPELAVVQDADRLDAIGAVGIGRVFTYGGARTDRDMHQSVDMMDFKLFKLEGFMKTEPGRSMARESTRRLQVFRDWWTEEARVEAIGLSVLESTVGSESTTDAEKSE